MSIQLQAWEFPKTHGVKAIGLSVNPIEATVLNLLKDLGLEFNTQSCTTKQSSNGKYTSVTVNIHFKNSSEVESLYRTLHAHPLIVQSL